MLSVRVEILSGGNRAHQHTRTKSWQEIWNLLEDSADAYAAATAADCSLQYTKLGAACRFLREVRHSCRKAAEDFLLSEDCKLTVEALELCDFFAEHRTREAVKHLVLFDDLRCEQHKYCLFICRNDFFVVEASFVSLDDRLEINKLCLCLDTIPGNPFLEGIGIRTDILTEGDFIFEPASICFIGNCKEIIKIILCRSDFIPG